MSESCFAALGATSHKRAHAGAGMFEFLLPAFKPEWNETGLGRTLMAVRPAHGVPVRSIP